VRPTVEQVLAAFERFHHGLMSAHAEEFASVELTMAQAKVIYVVVAGGELSLSEIAQRLGVTMSTASGAVDRLVELGMLSRTAVPTNRRQVSVTATPLGVQTIEQLGELGARQLRAVLDRVADEDLAVVQRAIEILADVMPPGPGAGRHARPGSVHPRPDTSTGVATRPGTSSTMSSSSPSANRTSQGSAS